MPILSAAQTVPAGKQTATLTVRTTATAEQVAAPAGQTLEVIDPNGPARVLSAAQVMEPGKQVVRIRTARLPAEPRAERQPAKPRL